MALLSTLLLTAGTLSAQITGIKTSDTCVTTVDIQLLGTGSFNEWFWNFGDPASGTNDTVSYYNVNSNNGFPYPTHTFSSPGVYTITCIYQEVGFPPDTITRTLQIGLCCTPVIAVNDTCLQTGVAFSIVSSETPSNVFWNFGEPGSGVDNTSTILAPTYEYNNAANYTVTAIVQLPCKATPDTISYALTVVDCATDTPDCTASVTYSSSCLSDSVLFSISASGAINSVLWNFGDTLSSANTALTAGNAAHSFASTGTYAITAIATLNCGIDTVLLSISIDSCNEVDAEPFAVTLPTAFSPNGDGVNEEFRVLSAYPLNRCVLKVYNRWGECVYEGNEIGDGWDGTYKGQASPLGVYVYTADIVLTDGKSKYIAGSVTLVR